jgi:hypothetical protein
LRYELHEGEDSSGADSGEGIGGAGEEEVKEAEAEGVALVI